VDAASAAIRLGRVLRTRLDQAFEPMGLTSQQAAVLIHVFTGTTSPTALADLLGSDTAATSRLVWRLVDKGLITRTAAAADRRAVVVALTAAGRAVVPSLPAVFEQVGRRMCEGIEAADFAAELSAAIGNLDT
jgi:DNA-binding MarR family transcriptional regulator